MTFLEWDLLIEEDNSQGNDKSNHYFLHTKFKLLIFHTGAKNSHEDDGKDVTGFEHHHYWKVCEINGIGIGES